MRYMLGLIVCMSLCCYRYW